MAIAKPYRRTCRQFVDGHYTEGGRWGYMVHSKFAQSPQHYVRAFLLILKDLQELFDYVEPADANCGCYSFRIHSLLLRACVEVEANCRAIIKENGYVKADPSMVDYKKIEKTHLLSEYAVRIPQWNGTRGVRTPFSAWVTGGSLPWYQAYNVTKHDRHTQFQTATFDHLMDAVCGLLVILSAQFYTNDFSPGPTQLAVATGWPADDMESGIGNYFRVRFPENWPVEQRYDFDWQALKEDPDPYQEIDYRNV